MRSLGAWLLVTCGVALCAGCAAAPRRAGPATMPADETSEADGVKEEPESIAGWEARQRQLGESLARLTGVRREAQDREHRYRPPQGGGATPSAPGPAPRPAARPTRGVRLDAPAAAPPPEEPAGTRQSIRCGRICRHVRAICHAANRVCQIARRLGDPPAAQACRRSRDRCADAQAVARQTCPTCLPGARTPRRARGARLACGAPRPLWHRSHGNGPWILDFVRGL